MRSCSLLRPCVLALAAPLGRGDALVAQLKKINKRGHVILAADVERHPAGLWQDVMRRGAASGHQLLTQAHGERQVNLLAAVHVADLVPVGAKLDATEAVRALRCPRPAED